MKSLEVRELEKRIGEILHAVQEQGEIIEVTNQGEVVVRIMPASDSSVVVESPEDEIWTDLERLSAEISAYWPVGLSAVDAVRDARESSI